MCRRRIQYPWQCYLVASKIRNEGKLNKEEKIVFVLTVATRARSMMMRKKVSVQSWLCFPFMWFHAFSARRKHRGFLVHVQLERFPLVDNAACHVQDQGVWSVRLWTDVFRLHLNTTGLMTKVFRWTQIACLLALDLSINLIVSTSCYCSNIPGSSSIYFLRLKHVAHKSNK